MKLNEEEKKIIETYEKGRIKTRKPSKDESTNIKAIAKNTYILRFHRERRNKR